MRGDMAVGAECDGDVAVGTECDSDKSVGCNGDKADSSREWPARRIGDRR
jgi:hypothetical protein